MWFDSLGPRLGPLVDGLIVVHVLAVTYWIFAAWRSASRTPATALRDWEKTK